MSATSGEPGQPLGGGQSNTSAQLEAEKKRADERAYGVHRGNLRSMETAKHLFRPLESRARLVTVFFWCYVATSAVAILAGAMAPMIGVDLYSENALPAEDTPLGSAVILLFAIALVLYLIFLIICIVVFLMWLYRARSNLPALGVANVRWSPGWSIAWWFIPIMSLFRPYQVVKETWQASDPADLPGWRREPPPAIFGWWWALFLVYSFGSNATDSTPTRGTPSFDTAALIDLAVLIIGIGSALCAMRIVRDITTRQTQRYQVGAFA
jgi:Domain of unknown function (DUF4328)